METQQLLDQFWEARGVFDPAQRKRLVEAAQLVPTGPTQALVAGTLPGIASAWTLDTCSNEVVEVSRRLMALQQLLGGSAAAASSSAAGDGSQRLAPEVDVVWMVMRQPGLLTADFNRLTSRLLEMKLATLGAGVDVLRVVEAQPGLLLNDDVDFDARRWQQQGQQGQQRRERAGALAAPGQQQDGDDEDGGGRGGRTSGRGDGDAMQQLVQAWQHGLSSDGDVEWQQRLAQLAGYKARYGDTSVGFRDGDDEELTRWAKKQRADFRRGQLGEDRHASLASVGFIFDADEAEWCRWFSQLVAFKAEEGHCSPMPLAGGGDMYLINWAAIQRIARRSRVLSDSRIERLDGLGFDWSGADPLS